MKKFISILMALLTATTLAACQSNTTQNKETTTKTESTSTSDTSNKQQSETNKKTEDTQIIGSDEYGYVKVPKTGSASKT